MNGKQGIIDVTVGNPERIHKDKSGHLLIVSKISLKYVFAIQFLIIGGISLTQVTKASGILFFRIIMVLLLSTHEHVLKCCNYV